jgi:metal-sulfur cluster biosynthetic enzyme
MNEITNDEAKLELALGALKFVDDPEIGLNVVDLGLIYQVDFDDKEKKIFVLIL